MAFTVSGLYYITERDIRMNDTSVDYVADSIKGALFTNTVTTANYSTDAAQYGAAPLNANEVSSAGYTAGGVVLASKVFSVETGNVLTYDAADLQWTGVTFTARGVLLWDDTITTPVADCALLGITFGADYPVTAGTFTVQWATPASGGVYNIDLA